MLFRLSTVISASPYWQRTAWSHTGCYRDSVIYVCETAVHTYLPLHSGLQSCSVNSLRFAFMSKHVNTEASAIRNILCSFSFCDSSCPEENNHSRMAENLVITEPECLPPGLCFMRVRLGTLKLNLRDCLASCTQRAMGWCAGRGTAPSHRWWGSSSWQSIAPAVPSCSPSPGNQPFFCSQEDEIAINKYNSKEKLRGCWWAVYVTSW